MTSPASPGLLPSASDDPNETAQDRRPSPVARLFASLPTGLKMLLILSIALFPLGLMALLASIENARANRNARTAEMRVLSTDSAARLNAAFGRTTLTLHAAATALALSHSGTADCRRTLALMATGAASRYRIAIYTSSGALLCASDGYTPRPPATLPDFRARAELDPVLDGVRLIVPAAVGRAVAVVEMPSANLAAIARPLGAPAQFGEVLRQGASRIELVRIGRRALSSQVETVTPIAGGQIELVTYVRAPPLRAVELLTMLLPILMWIAAAAIGWIVVDRLLLRPLALLHGAVSSYCGGRGALVIPTLTTPAFEIRRLSRAFADLATAASHHEAELEAGLARQTKLTREVHHRVKNNLQVVSSLINLHARGARSADAAAAYASIQRRVDALAVVHRNHFAELEENRGVGLRALIGELAANLRATAGPAAPVVTIAVAIDPLHAHQDVAVPVAFLVTETVELAMQCDPRPAIAIRLHRTVANRALLSIESSALRASPCLIEKLAERYGRVLEGLSRQLRARLVRDDEAGAYAIEIATLD